MNQKVEAINCERSGDSRKPEEKEKRQWVPFRNSSLGPGFGWLAGWKNSTDLWRIKSFCCWVIGINWKSSGLDSRPREIDPHRGLIVVTFSTTMMMMLMMSQLVRLEEWLEKFLESKKSQR